MAFTVYKSSDTSAPTLNGTAGTLIAVLDACLVNGYGSQTAAGWAKEYSGTNKAVYRAPSGARLRYRIDDNGPGAGTFKEARIIGYETMTDMDTGTNPFPGSSLFLRKSATLDATSRAWIVIADARTVYMFLAAGDTPAYSFTSFGELYSLVPGDPYNGYIMARATENTNSYAGTIEGSYFLETSMSNSNVNGQHLCRPYTGAVGSTSFRKGANPFKSAAGTGMGVGGAIPYPNPVDGGLFVDMIHIAESSGAYRGRMRGLWNWCHTAQPNNLDTFNGSGQFAGKTFLCVRTFGGLNTSMAVFETSDTLETN